MDYGAADVAFEQLLEDVAASANVAVAGGETKREGEACAVKSPAADHITNGAPAFSLIVHGRPAPQGSKRHVGGGRLVESSKHLQPWRDAVRGEAQRHHHGAPLDGPLRLLVIFTLPKPVSAPKRRTTWPDRVPDLSKLVRATEDALTDAGVWVDDARVVETASAKRYPNEGSDALGVPGVLIRIWTLGGTR